MQNKHDDFAQRAREMANLIRRFLAGSVGQYEWDDFMGVAFSDPRLEKARVECETILSGARAGIMSDDVESVRLIHLADRLESLV